MTASIPPAQRLNAVVMWTSMLLSQALLVGVSIAVFGRASTPIEPQRALSAPFADEIAIALFVASLAALAGSIALPMALARRAGGTRSDARRAQTALFVGLALAEACTLFGVVSTVVGGGAAERVVLPAVLATCALVVVHFPSQRRLALLAGERDPVDA